MPWRFVEPEIVYFDDGMGVFVFCLECWEDIPASDRADRLITALDSTPHRKPLSEKRKAELREELQ
jgi:hypothetical protein